MEHKCNSLEDRKCFRDCFHLMLPSKPLSRLPQGGEAKTNLKPSLALETQRSVDTEKDSPPCPLPFGRGANRHAD